MVASSMFTVTPPHWSAQSPAVKTKECVPGVVSPPVVATWIVLVNQSHPSGVPCAPGALTLVSFQGFLESLMLFEFQSPAKIIEPTGKLLCPFQRGAINSVFH